MEPSTVALIGLLSGMAGALLIESLKQAYQRRQAGAQVEEARLESLPESAPQAGTVSVRGALDAPASAFMPDPPAPPTPPLPPIPPTPAISVSSESGESEITRVDARASMPVNPAIGERGMKPIPESPSPPSPPAPPRSGSPAGAGGNGNSRKRTPVMIYSQDSSILTTVENSDEVEAILQASRKKPGAPRKSSKASSGPEPVGPEPVPAPLPEVRPTLEEEAAARPAGIPFWLMYVLLGVSILLALAFLFLALQPILGF